MSNPHTLCISVASILYGWFLLYHVALYDSCGRPGKVLPPAMSHNYNAAEQYMEQLLNKTFLGAFQVQIKIL